MLNNMGTFVWFFADPMQKKKDLLKVNLLTRTLLLRRTFVVTATTYVWQGIRATQGKVKKERKKENAATAEVYLRLCATEQESKRSEKEIPTDEATTSATPNLQSLW